VCLANATKPIVVVVIVHVVVVRTGARTIPGYHRVVVRAGIGSRRSNCASIWKNLSGSPEKFPSFNQKGFDTWKNQVRSAAHNNPVFQRQP